MSRNSIRQQMVEYGVPSIWNGSMWDMVYVVRGWRLERKGIKCGDRSCVSGSDSPIYRGHAGARCTREIRERERTITDHGQSQPMSHIISRGNLILRKYFLGNLHPKGRR